MEIFFLVALGLGLASTLHCVGMCGGIMGALTFGLPEEVRNDKYRQLAYITTYNLGRITSYTFAGVIAGQLIPSSINAASREFSEPLTNCFCISGSL